MPLPDPIRRRVENMIGRAVVWMADNAKKLQELQISLQANEVRTAERFQQYGFSGVPLSESEAVILFPGGLRDHAIAIAVDDRRYRPTDQEAGEVCLYHFEGDSIRLRNGRIIEVVAGQALTVTAPEVTVFASVAVRLETPAVEMTGNLTVNGNITSGGVVQGNTVRTAGGVQLGTHIHSGVTAGGANTGAPVP
jgi:phage baseplate assembly protein V